MRCVLLAVVGLAVFAGVATSAPVPKALLKKKPLRATIEPLPGEQVYTVAFDNLPFAKVAEELERLTGLLFLAKDSPQVKVTLKAEKVCVAELFAQLDELLDSAGWVLARKSQSFTILQVSELGNWPASLHFPYLSTPTDLNRRSPLQPVNLVVTVGEGNLAVAEKVVCGIEGPGFTGRAFGVEKFQLTGRVADIQKFVAEMGDHIKK